MHDGKRARCGMLSTDTDSDIDRAFYNVLNRFIYTPDTEAWGNAEYWASPKEMAAHADADGFVHGDCDDFAILCRDELKKFGLRSRLVFCSVETGGFHLVCEIEGWVLDNRHKFVMSRDELPYKWISISGYVGGEPWHLIEQDKQ